MAAGALVVNVLAGAPVPVAAGIAAGNTLEALLATLALERLGFRASLDRVRDVLALVLVAALASTAVAATVGVASLRLGGVIPAGHEAEAWRAWWLGDMGGVLLVAPALLAWVSGPRVRPRARRVAEAGALLAAASAAWLFVFFGVPPAGIGPFHQIYLVFPFLIWAGLRLGVRGVTATMLLVSVLAILGTAVGRGPFVPGPLHESLTRLQIFFGVVAVTGLLLGAVVAERAAAQVDLGRMYDEARRALRARDDFLSVASHELRTPLATLVLQLDALKRSLGGPRNEAAGPPSDRVERLVKTTARLTRLVDGVLDVSLLAGGHLALQLEDCDLAEVARDLGERMEDEARRAGCELVVSAPAPVVGRWDRLRLEQALGNLVSNAVKWGGGLPVEVSAAASATGATLSVRDHGVGISAEDLRRIFDRFERASPPEHYGGLGLGLYLTRRIVAEHGGEIRVTSEPGAGSLFEIELPRRALARPPHGAEAR